MSRVAGSGQGSSAVEADQSMRGMFYRLINAREAPELNHVALHWVKCQLAAVPPNAGPMGPEALAISPGVVDVGELPWAGADLLAFHAPVGLIEGAWLASVAQASNGHLESVVDLFAAYLRLLGADEVAAPAAVYRAQLVRSGVSLPSLASWRFAQHERVGLPALAFAVVQLALGLHPRALFPELIGFTLAYAGSASSWRLCGLPADRRQGLLRDVWERAQHALQGHLCGLDPEVWKLQWSRIRQGYGLYQSVEADYLTELQMFATKRCSLVDRVAEIVRRRVRVARGYHRNALLGGRPLADWFAEEPFDAAGFLREFAASPYAEGESGARPFDRLAGFGGPMFGVFDDDELRLIGAWLDGSNQDGVTGALSLPEDRTFPAFPIMGEAPKSMSVRSGLGRRELFYRLVNADRFPAIAGTARRHVEVELTKAARAIGSRGPLRERFFPYTPAALRKRIGYLHDTEVARYRPFKPPPRLERDEYVWGIRQFAPAILMDGCWLQHMGEAASQHDRVHRLLYRIYADELGAGVVEHNHPNVYRKLLRGLAIDLPPVDSEEFAQHPGFLDAAFDLPVYLLGISLLPRSFMAELLGLNLAIELSGLGADYLRLADEMRYWGLDSLIVDLHLSIDNLATGHAAMAVEAIDLYLDEIRAVGGDAAVDVHWRRIWAGFVSLRTVTRRFKWALGLDFCRRFLPGRLRRGLGLRGFVPEI